MLITPCAFAPTTSFCMYISGADMMFPGSAATKTAIAPAWPLARQSVPSRAFRARSQRAPPLPDLLPHL